MCDDNNLVHVRFHCCWTQLLLTLQGANASALEKEIGPEQFPVNEHYFGLVNVSGTVRVPDTWGFIKLKKKICTFHLTF